MPSRASADASGSDEQSMEAIVRAGDHDKLLAILDGKHSKDTASELLHLACEAGRTECVRILLDKGADVNWVKGERRNKSTPLLSAVSSKAPPSTVEVLLSHAVDVDSKISALVHAAAHGYLDALRLIAGSSDDITTFAYPQGNSPLLCAALRVQMDCIKYLVLEAKCNVNDQNEYGNTALHLIVSRPGDSSEAKEGVDFLCAHGADPTILNRYGDTPLLKAARQGNTDCAKVMLRVLKDKGIDVNGLKSKKGSYLLHECVECAATSLSQLAGAVAVPGMNAHSTSKMLQLIEALLDEYSADPNQRDANGSTPLHFIQSTPAPLASVEHIRVLLEHEADPSARNEAGDSPLHVSGPSVEAVDLLVAGGADVNLLNAKGASPAASALGAGYMHKADALVRHGGVLTAPNISSSTLHRACCFPDVEMLVSKLVDWNPSWVHSRDAEGNTPVHLACRENIPHYARLFVGRGADLCSVNADGQTPLALAIQSDALEIIVDILTNGAQPASSGDLHALREWRDDAGDSMLHRAVRAGAAHAVRLLARHIDVNTINDEAVGGYVDGGSPLHLGAQRGQLQCIEILLECGADVNSQASYLGNTPLHISHYEGHAACVAALVAAGADTAIKNERGELPAHLAGQKTDASAMIPDHS